MNIEVLVQSLSSLSWLAVIGLLALVVVRASRHQVVKATTSAMIVVIILAIVLTTVSAGLVFIQPNERGVVVSAFSDTGMRSTVLQPGLRWVIPFAEQVVPYSISKQTYTMSISTSEGQIMGDDSVSARTLDGQEIFIDASVIFAIDPAKVLDVHVTWQNRYSDDLVRPTSRGVIRDLVSQYRVEEIVSTQRDVLVKQIHDNLSAKMADNGLILVDFVLRNITFTAEYATSVEQKQIAEQQAQQAKFVVESKKQEAEQARQIAQGKADAVVIASKGDAEARIIQAQAEAQALQLIADVLKENPDLLTYQYINQLAPGIQVMLVPNDNPFLLPLPSLDTTGGTVISPTPVPTLVPTPAPTTTP